MSFCILKVWKAYLDESTSGGPPSYLVAAKTVAGKSASAAASQELRDEANVMAQLASHPNVLAIVGVITVGYPLVLVMSYCEHGSLLSYLKKNAKDGEPIGYLIKLQLGVDIACGMGHLASRSFIHRDLACRNVLVSSELVGIIADFGLSRGGATGASAAGDDSADDAPEYYRSKTGIAPVRWTAPEALQHNRFSIASDVWSYGIVVTEMIQDGGRPYGQWLDVDKVAYKVKEGSIHKQPEGCPDELYAILLQCWAFKTEDRPTFPSLVKSVTVLLDRGRDGADANPHEPDYALVGEHEEIYKQKLYQRLSSDVADTGAGITALSLYSKLRDTPIVSFQEAVTATEVTCESSFQEEADLALSFAKRLFATPRGKQHLRTLNINEAATFHMYTQETNLYKKMNSTLGGWGDSDPKDIPHFLPFVQLMVTAMAKLEPVACVVYRGVRQSLAETIGDLKVGDTLTWGAFTSSTLSPDVLRDPQFLGMDAELGERVVFEIKILTGVKIHHFSDKGSAAEYFQSGGHGDVFAENEQEVLIRPGTKFRLVAITRRANNIVEVKMEEVPEETDKESDMPRPSGASIKVKTLDARVSTGGTSEYAAITEDFEEEEIVENTYLQPGSPNAAAKPIATESTGAEGEGGAAEAGAAKVEAATATAAFEEPELGPLPIPLPPRRLPMTTEVAHKAIEESAC